MPTIDALEIVVAIACAPDRVWTVADLRESVRPVAEGTLVLYLRRLQGQGLLAAEGSQGFRYELSSPAIRAAVEGLCKTYDEKPVTLIRSIYRIADTRQIQFFADAFRLRRDD